MLFFYDDSQIDSSVTYEDGEMVEQSGSYDENVEVRRYEWEYNGYTWYYDFPVSLRDIKMYEKERRNPENYYSVYSNYVDDTRDDEYFQSLAQSFVDDVLSVGWREDDAVFLAVSFVQNLEYIAEGEFEEYPKYPLETIYDGGGDCEDSSILLASILKEMGYGCAMIGFEDHAAVGILSDNLDGVYYELDGRKYYYIETTAPGWEAGQIPNEYAQEDARVIPF